MASHRSASPPNDRSVAAFDFGAVLASGHGLALLTVWLCILPLTPALVLSALIARQADGLKRKVLHQR